MAGLGPTCLVIQNYLLMALASPVTAWFSRHAGFSTSVLHQAEAAIRLSGLGGSYCWRRWLWYSSSALRIQQMRLPLPRRHSDYAGLMGLGLTPILLLYTGASVAQVFVNHGGDLRRDSLGATPTSAIVGRSRSFLFMGLIESGCLRGQHLPAIGHDCSGSSSVLGV